MVLIAIGVAIVLLLALAPVWQLANGRTDIRRSHAALMRFLWPSIAIVLLIVGGIVTWWTHVSPADLVVRYVGQPRRGTSVIVTGRAPGAVDYSATFVLDRATGKFTRIAAPPWSGWQFSDDGRVLVWPQPVGISPSSGVELHTLSGGTGIVVSPSSSFVLSSDGSRVAITNGKLLAVHELTTGKLLASAAGLSSLAGHRLFFVTQDLVRVIEQERRLTPVPLRIFELDVRARKTRKTGERLLAEPAQVSVSGDGSRMFLRGDNVIADGRTGETLAAIEVSSPSLTEMLYDGRVAWITRDGGVLHLRIRERDGTPLHDIFLPNARPVRIAGETEDGKLIVSAHGRATYIVDVASGVVERTLDGVSGPTPRWSHDPRLTRYAADHEFVGLDRNGKLLVWEKGQASAHPLVLSR